VAEGRRRTHGHLRTWAAVSSRGWITLVVSLVSPVEVVVRNLFSVHMTPHTLPASSRRPLLTFGHTVLRDVGVRARAA